MCKCLPVFLVMIIQFTIDISCYVIFQETLLKWICKFIHYVSLILESFGGVCVILNDEVFDILNLCSR